MLTDDEKSTLPAPPARIVQVPGRHDAGAAALVGRRLHPRAPVGRRAAVVCGLGALDELGRGAFHGSFRDHVVRFS